MPTLPPVFRAPGRPTAQDLDRDRGSARERGYSSSWDKAAARHKAEHPFCRYCELGVFGAVRVAPADLVDHLYPQRQHPGSFWLKAYWVSCCSDCHNGPKQALERRGRPALDDLARRLGLAPLPA